MEGGGAILLLPKGCLLPQRVAGKANVAPSGSKVCLQLSCSSGEAESGEGSVNDAILGSVVVTLPSAEEQTLDIEVDVLVSGLIILKVQRNGSTLGCLEIPPVV